MYDVCDIVWCVGGRGWYQGGPEKQLYYFVPVKVSQHVFMFALREVECVCVCVCVVRG
jgi:hypothetical protein